MRPMMMAPEEIGGDALVHLKALLRFDTTNPPGNEGPAVDYLDEVCKRGGLETKVVRSPAGRPNLIVRLKGTGARRPLLLHGHLDVVPADAARWTRPPFDAVESDGYLWGRGAIDMKNMAAMAAAVLVGIKRAGLVPARDLIFAAVADEEVGCDEGSGFIVEQHPELVRDAEFAIGEGGGFTVHVGGKRFYPIMSAEKGVAWLRLVAEGKPGHGSMPDPDSAVNTLLRALFRITAARMPLHRSEIVDRFVRSLAKHAPFPAGLVFPLLLRENLRDFVLDHLFPTPEIARPFASLLANTVSATVLRAGERTNVIPGAATAELDGRTLPGQSTDDLIRELLVVAGEKVRFEVIRSSPPSLTSPDTDFFAHLCAMIRRYDPGAIPVPSLSPGFTDAKSWRRLGIRCYGFLPLQLPPDLKFSDLFHGDDERIPVAGLLWGTRVLWDTLLEA